MAIKTPKDNLILLPKEVLEKLRGASAEELKTLIYLFAEPESTASDAARETGLTVAQVEAACAFWRGAGVFADAAQPKKKVASDSSAYRNYDSATLSDAVENNGDFALVCQFAGERLGKQLNKNDLSTLFYLFDYVGLPAPVICGITEYCCAKEKKSIQYIFKKSLSLYEDEGVDSYDKLEAYIARMEAIRSNIGQLRRLFGMGERALTPKEEKLYNCWFGEWGFSFEMVKLAYEKTVDNISKLDFKYMNSILRRWHESGYETEEDVNSGDSAKNSGTQSSFDEDEFIEAALAKGFE
ncbi:MAG: DnaD domain protein [Clostridia bacterium]|nr:DnaD domain protein [Clostridia bacterium]